MKEQVLSNLATIVLWSLGWALITWDISLVIIAALTTLVVLTILGLGSLFGAWD